MVLDKLQNSLFGAPLADLRPSKAHPEHRARRKQLERESPAFSMGEFGIKTAMMGLLALVACFPWEKEVEKHERRLREEEEGKRRRRERGDRGGGDGDGGRREGRDDEREMRRVGERRTDGRRRRDDRGVRVYHYGKSFAW
jgi:hypothetical protein